MIPRFLIALPAAALLGALSYRSAGVRAVEPVDRIASAFARERNHDVAGAERDLLAGAEWDHLYEPRWTLAGFYYRQNRVDDFWTWTRRALAVGTHDLGGLFDLCWQVTDNASTIWQRAMPERKEVWNEYLAYLLTAQHWNAAVDTAGRLAPRATGEDLPMLLGFCDLAIEKDAQAALPVWNSLCQRRLIESTAIGPAHFLVNGDLARRPLGRGFDWRLPSVAGVRTEWMPREIHASFSGNQADGAEAIVQHLALAPAGRYRFTYRYRTQNMVGDLYWRISSDTRSTSLSSDVEKQGTLEFSGGAATLALACEHACAGSIVLREMDIVRE